MGKTHPLVKKIMAKPKNKEVKNETVENTETVEAKADDGMTLEKAIAIVECPGVHVRRPQPGSVAERQLFHFANQEKVRYRLPRASGDPKGAFETDVTNDLMITVEKGVTVSLPDDVAQSFDDAQGITDAALHSHLNLKDTPQELR